MNSSANTQRVIILITKLMIESQIIIQDISHSLNLIYANHFKNTRENYKNLCSSPTKNSSKKISVLLMRMHLRWGSMLIIKKSNRKIFLKLFVCIQAMTFLYIIKRIMKFRKQMRFLQKTAHKETESVIWLTKIIFNLREMEQNN